MAAFPSATQYSNIMAAFLHIYILCTIIFTHIRAQNTINCTAGTSCRCTDGAGPCIINCIGQDTCKDRTNIQCSFNEACIINCQGENTCSNIYSNAEESGDTALICDGPQACSNAYVLCGVGDCSVTCIDSSSCDGLFIDTQEALTFDCNGLCPPHIPTPFPATTASPTQNPTISPTNNPAASPTTNPTLLPTNTPTIKTEDGRATDNDPTHYPTTIPLVAAASNSNTNPIIVYTVIAIVALVYCLVIFCSVFMVWKRSKKHIQQKIPITRNTIHTNNKRDETVMSMSNSNMELNANEHVNTVHDTDSNITIASNDCITPFNDTQGRGEMIEMQQIQLCTQNEDNYEDELFQAVSAGEGVITSQDTQTKGYLHEEDGNVPPITNSIVTVDGNTVGNIN